MQLFSTSRVLASEASHLSVLLNFKRLRFHWYFLQHPFFHLDELGQAAARVLHTRGRNGRRTHNYITGITIRSLKRSRDCLYTSIGIPMRINNENYVTLWKCKLWRLIMVLFNIEKTSRRRKLTGFYSNNRLDIKI